MQIKQGARKPTDFLTLLNAIIIKLNRTSLYIDQLQAGYLECMHTYTWWTAGGEAENQFGRILYLCNVHTTYGNEPFNRALEACSIFWHSRESEREEDDAVKSCKQLVDSPELEK